MAKKLAAIFNSSTLISDSEDDEEEEEDNLSLRAYQIELAEPALRGENCIIVAPTGSGKTRVATKICQEHMKKNSKAKIIFLVPTVPLVNQQYKSLRQYLENENGNVVNYLSGEISQMVPVKATLTESIITVMTPQILKNRLNSYDNTSDKSELLNIQEISLIIFDECHHAVQRHPYNQIMGIYFDEKYENHLPLPQIVGLTASPGIGKGEEPEKALESILILMANMNVTQNPVLVRENIQELEQYNRKQKKEIVIAVLKPDTDTFTPRISKIMTTIESQMKDEFYKINEENIIFPQKGTEQYVQFIVEFSKIAVVLPRIGPRRKLINYANNLRKYNDSLEINDHVRATDAVKYIDEDLFENEPRNSIKEYLKKLYEEYMKDYEPTHVNPMLTNLENQILKHFQKKPDSKCIVFARTRAIAAGLVLFLQANKKLQPLQLDASYLTGTNAKQTEYGMTPAMQDTVVQSFKGNCKLIVATSVAEEGLDIQSCNMIITYNYSTSEIGSVQRIGRARAGNVRIVIISHEDSKFIKLENKNKLNAELTKLTLNKMYELPSSEIKERVLEKQVELKGVRIHEKQLPTEDMREPASKSVWLLSCKECRTEVISSNKLALLNKQHHIAADVNFRMKARFVDLKNPRRIGDDEYTVGKIYCNNSGCRSDWGNRMKYKNCFLSVIKISGFVMEKGGETKHAAKWKNAPFKVTHAITFPEIAEIIGDYTH